MDFTALTQQEVGDSGGAHGAGGAAASFAARFDKWIEKQALAMENNLLTQGRDQVYATAAAENDYRGANARAQWRAWCVEDEGILDRDLPGPTPHARSAALRLMARGVEPQRISLGDATGVPPASPAAAQANNTDGGAAGGGGASGSAAGV
jgi:hypothetical protein